MTEGQNLHYFAAANTAGGYKQELMSQLKHTNHIFSLTGNMQPLISQLLHRIATIQLSKSRSVWYLHNPLNPDYLDGIIIPELKTAVLYTTLLQNFDPENISRTEINMDDAFKQPIPPSVYEQASLLEQLIASACQAAYNGFGNALLVHDDWEAVFRPYINFNASNQLTEQYIDILFADHVSEAAEPHSDTRFLGTATSKGAIDYIHVLAEGLQKYHLKGRAGSGKSTMLRKIAKAAEEKGFSYEIYRCGLDPGSVDMVIVRQLGFAIFDSTAPHEYHPEPGDIVIDLYEKCMDPDTDQLTSERISEISSSYRAIMKEASAQLILANQWQEQKQQLFAPYINKERFDQLSRSLLAQLD